jgi:ribosomal protein L7/L12
MWNDLPSLAIVLGLSWAGKAILRRFRPAVEPTPPTEDLARDLALRRKNIEAIRVIRQLHGVPLGEAKQWVEEAVAGQR